MKYSTLKTICSKDSDSIVFSDVFSMNVSDNIRQRLSIFIES